MAATPKFILAVPKGRILKELKPLMKKAGITADPDFYDEDSRALRFRTSNPSLDLIRVRAFDVATFVAYGAAHMGIAGSDVLEEFNYSEIYAPVNLGIGHCRLSVAAPANDTEARTAARSHIRIATKYPQLTRRHFAEQGIQAECIKLNGAMEIAPALDLAPYIVDLVSTGGTLKANGLRETETILQVSSRLVVNRTAIKTEPEALGEWVENFRKATA
ncbi:MAG TPA: ATP phosphoribosyltransferase [Alphaproteobacteria bacterium]|nr:ATP phosphoribosyltransferase [Micavibrio sp.]HQX27223.1 ATP phosphoribosyltransferase [Alphaproteobacteria bacterium]